MERCDAAVTDGTPQVVPVAEVGASEPPQLPSSPEAALPPVTDANGWRAMTAAQALRLPSGVIVTVKRPDWIMLRGAGEINEAEIRTAVLGQGTVENRLDLSRKLAPHIVKSPVVVTGDQPYDRDTSIAVCDIPDSDLVAIFMWAIGIYTGQQLKEASGE